MNQYRLMLAGVPVDCTFIFKETAELFGHYCIRGSFTDNSISIPESGWRFWEEKFGKRDAHAEFSLFSSYLSSVLISQHRCIFHAAAFSVNGSAWLISAPSGTGKSTQLKTLKELYPDKIITICGDRPILELTDDGKVIVHPSPWNGKEGWGGNQSAYLKGIIILTRGKENNLWKVPQSTAVVPVYCQILNPSETEEHILEAASFADELLKRTDTWLLENENIPNSTKLLYEKLLGLE